MEDWSAENIPNIQGKVAVVTGANSGLGFQTALQLAKHGSFVILACRDLEKGNRAAQTILREVPSARVKAETLDLANSESIAKFSEKMRKDHPILSLLVNNAGVMNLPFRKTKDGFEMQFGTNHLGHFALTGKLLPSLLMDPSARIVTVSSFLHRFGQLDFDHLNSERVYSPTQAYYNSKLANLIFAIELDRLLKKANKTQISVAAHPGYAATNLQFAGPKMEGSRLKEWIMSMANRIAAQSDSQGALPILFACTDPSVQGGEFFGPNGFKEMWGFPKRVKGIGLAYDPEIGKRLWTSSEKLTGIHYHF